MSQFFREVVAQFQSQHQYDKFIKEAQKEYDVKIYRLQSFSREYALEVYNELQERYASEGLQPMSHGWHQNQRRLYVWFIVCFIHLKMLEPNKFVDGQKYWKLISSAFFEKDIPFLKYQLLTLLKTRGRTTWKPKQDELLKEAQRKFDKGMWNEVAKHFYFQSRGEYFKTPKQCRQRWQNHLNDEIIKGEWSKEEDRTILESVKKNGAHWASIVPLLHNTRTEHMIKNRYKSIINKVMQDRKLSEGEAILEAIRNLDQVQTRFSEDIRDNHGVLQVDSQEIIEQPQQQIPVIERRKRKEKKRGRPKKIKNQEPPRSMNSFGINNMMQNRSMQSREMRNSNNSGLIIEGNVSLQRRNHIFDNFSNFSNLFGGNNNRSNEEFFNSGRLSFRNSGFGYPTIDEDKSSLFMGHGSSRLRSREGFQPILLEGDSYHRSRRLSFKNANDSLISGIFK